MGASQNWGLPFWGSLEKGLEYFRVEIAQTVGFAGATMTSVGSPWQDILDGFKDNPVLHPFRKTNGKDVLIYSFR